MTLLVYTANRSHGFATGGHDAIYSSTTLLVYDSLLCCSMCIEESARTSLPGSTGFGGGFFLAARILGEGSANHSPPPLFPKRFFILIPLFTLGSVPSGSAS